MDGPRVPGPLWAMGGGVGEGTWIFLFMINGPAKPLGLVWEKSPVSGSGGGWPGRGEQEAAPRARLGADETRSPAQGHSLGLSPGRGVGCGVGCIPQRQAWRLEAARGLRWTGWEGSLCLGLVTLEHLTLLPSPPPPRWPPWGGGGNGAGEPGWGVPGVPSLVFLERLNGKCLADGGPLCSRRGQRCWHPLHQSPHPVRDCSPSGGLLQRTSPAVPALGGDKSANRSPPLG